MRPCFKGCVKNEPFYDCVFFGWFGSCSCGAWFLLLDRGCNVTAHKKVAFGAKKGVGLSISMIRVCYLNSRSIKFLAYL